MFEAILRQVVGWVLVVDCPCVPANRTRRPAAFQLPFPWKQSTLSFGVDFNAANLFDVCPVATPSSAFFIDDVIWAASRRPDQLTMLVRQWLMLLVVNVAKQLGLRLLT